MKVEVEEIVAAAPDRVWAALSDFGWFRKTDLITDVRVEGSGVGAVRAIVLADGSVVKERLESFDPEARTFSYAIINRNPAMPVDSYLATVRVGSHGQEGSIVNWTSVFEPTDPSNSGIAGFLESVYRGSAKTLRTRLGV